MLNPIPLMLNTPWMIPIMRKFPEGEGITVADTQLEYEKLRFIK